jgi:diguanylate cyclase (GGDEF)-like protein
MTATTAPRAPLAATLVRKVFSVYVILAISLTTLQIAAEYRSTYYQILDELESITRAFEPGVTDALWNYQLPLLESIAKGLVGGHTVTAVEIGDVSGVRVRLGSAGEGLTARPVSYRLALSHATREGGREQIGYIAVQSSHSVVIDRVKYGVLQIMAIALLKTIGLWLIIVAFANRLLADPLRRFTRQIQEMDLASAAEAPRIDLGTAQSRELIYLRDSFNDLTDKAVANRRMLNRLAADLEQRVLERTTQLSEKNQALEQEVAVRQAAEMAVARERDLTLALIQAIPEIFFLVAREGGIVMYNPNSRQALGLADRPSDGDAGSRAAQLVQDFVALRDREAMDKLLAAVFAEGNGSCEAELLFADARAVPHYLVGHRVLVDGVPHAIIVGVDITERRVAEDRMRHLAMHDALTGLPNRSMLQPHMQQAIVLAQRRREWVAILFVDLDDFKPINDRAGHEVGDAVLRAVAQRLKQAVRASDIVARYGGDEFVVVVSGLNDEAGAAAVGRKIIDAVSEPILDHGVPYQVSASVGISFFPEHGEDIDRLLETADVAMYRAKREGKGRVAFAPPPGSSVDAT